jgi:uncharacterized membrane-anchored protein YhcB (DUF1043 family)
MQILFSILIGLIIGAILIYFVLRPKIKIAQELDQEIITQNEKRQEENNSFSP